MEHSYCAAGRAAACSLCVCVVWCVCVCVCVHDHSEYLFLLDQMNFNAYILMLFLLVVNLI